MFKNFSINFKFNKSINKLIFIFCLFIFSGCGLDIGKAGSWEASGYDSGDATVGDSGDNSEVNPVDFVKLSWMSPMSKADGSALTNLGGYMVYYRNTDAITQVYSMDVGNITSATIDNLSQGTWCFAISAYNEADIESELSNYACKDI